MKLSLVIAAGLLGLALTTGVASAGSSITAPNTPATDIHGAPGNTPGFGGSSANPNGQGVAGGNGIHNIAGGAPGQDGNVTPGEKGGPSNDMHGGLDATTGRFN